jgi:hypothetical protein
MASKRDAGTLRPNELSVDLVPNRLEWLEGQRPGRIVARPAAVDARRAAIAHPQTRSIGRPQTRSIGQQPRRRLNLSTILGLAIVLIVFISRILGGLQATSPRPATTAAPAAASVRAGPAHVVFGRHRAADCRVTDPATDFASKEPIWWTATFSSPRDGGKRVRWRVLHGAAIEAEEVGPSEAPASSWDVLCGFVPLTFGPSGTYRLEVRDIDDGALLAADDIHVH